MKIEDIEKAGKIYIENLLDYHIDYTIINNEEDNYEAGREHALSEFGADIFKAGAEWMEKHFSWISVEERLPESKEKVLVLNRMKHHDKYFVSENIYINGNLAARSAMYYEEIAWMPIPSFDEILEANRDVLERIKEKGD